MDGHPVEISAVVRDVAVEHGLQVSRPLVNVFLQMVGDNRHASFRLLVASLESAHTAEAER